MTQTVAEIDTEMEERSETAALRLAAVARKACCRCGQPIKKGEWLEITTIGVYKVWCHEGCHPVATTATIDLDEVTGNVTSRVVEFIEREAYQKTLADKLGPVVSDGVANAVSSFVSDTVKQCEAQ